MVGHGNGWSPGGQWLSVEKTFWESADSFYPGQGGWEDEEQEKGCTKFYKYRPDWEQTETPIQNLQGCEASGPRHTIQIRLDRESCCKGSPPYYTELRELSPTWWPQPEMQDAPTFSLGIFVILSPSMDAYFLKTMLLKVVHSLTLGFDGWSKIHSENGSSLSHKLVSFNLCTLSAFLIVKTSPLPHSLTNSQHFRLQKNLKILSYFSSGMYKIVFLYCCNKSWVANS